MPTVSDRRTDGAAAPRPEPWQRAIGAYLGLAVGDALGATVEFMTAREIVAAYGVHRRIVGGGWLRLRPGQVTDDTEMSLALGDSILTVRGIEARAVAEAFSAWMRTKPVDIGHTVRRGVSRYRRTGETEAPYDEHGAGNGACMRCLPVALATLGAPAEVVRQGVLVQARVTHHNALSDAATELVVHLVQAALRGVDLGGLEAMVHRFVQEYPVFEYRKGRAVTNPSGYIVDTLQAVFQALFGQRELAAALTDVVNRGGDADTTGAILGMIGGALWGDAAIPGTWLRRMDHTVVTRCSTQALRLLELAPACRQPAGTG